MYYQLLEQFKLSLQNLAIILEKGQKYAESRSFDPNNLLNSRLAPDQFNLLKQVQITCDNAKNGIARLTGKDAPLFEDKESSILELQQRIANVLNYLDGFQENDFNGASERTITLPFLKGVYLTGQDYLIQYLIPNFFFHYNTAYSILRHNGVEIGKYDYMGKIRLHNLE